MYGLVRSLVAEGIESRERWRFEGAPQHMTARTLAGVPHILEARRSQQFRNQLQLQIKRSRLANFVSLDLRHFPPNIITPIIARFIKLAMGYYFNRNLYFSLQPHKNASLLIRLSIPFVNLFLHLLNIIFVLFSWYHKKHQSVYNKNGRVFIRIMFLYNSIPYRKCSSFANKLHILRPSFLYTKIVYYEKRNV